MFLHKLFTTLRLSSQGVGSGLFQLYQSQQINFVQQCPLSRPPFLLKAQSLLLHRDLLSPQQAPQAWLLRFHHQSATTSVCLLQAHEPLQQQEQLMQFSPFAGVT